MTEFSQHILCVDDETNVLQAYERQLRKRFHVETAVGGENALEAIANRGPFAVVLTDMRMPGMDGVQFLTRLQDRAPDTVRMMLTGNADLQTAVNAVNDGRIFRFLTKPCPPDTLSQALEAGIQQYRLIKAEQELLEQTLHGSIQALTEVLSLVNPEAFGRSARIQRYVKDLAVHMGVTDVWRYEMAAMLSQIGCVVLPEGVLKKVYSGVPLSPEETQVFNQHPFIASDLLGKIPRMEEVAEIISYQEKQFDGAGIPHDSRKGDAIPLGARMLKVVLDFDALETAGKLSAEAFRGLQEHHARYDPVVLKAFQEVLGQSIRYARQDLKISELRPGMMLAEDLKDPYGVLLIAKGQEVTTSLITRLQNFLTIRKVREPIGILIPIQKKE